MSSIYNVNAAHFDSLMKSLCVNLMVGYVQNLIDGEVFFPLK